MVCEACVVVMAGKPPNTERMWSHLVDGDSHVRVNKGNKPTIREFLRGPKAATWFAAIADSGKKHLIPWAPLNVGTRRPLVNFEERIVELGDWSLVDELSELLTLGATKEELGCGDYGPRAWTLCGAEGLRAFEERWSGLRGGGWFDFAVWLAQRDEARVEERLAAEKAAKEAKKHADREAKRVTKKPDHRRPARSPDRVSQDTGVLGPDALRPNPGPTASRSANDIEPRGVGDGPVAGAAPGRPQLDLFGGDPRARR